ncbi:hypothetical protein MP228_005562 [Amoeboaphelidium protococcarum]|nr:hypothetical protein MP228_005562 [Amoeboaphelidium protococcarum]
MTKSSSSSSSTSPTPIHHHHHSALEYSHHSLSAGVVDTSANSFDTLSGLVPPPTTLPSLDMTKQDSATTTHGQQMGCMSEQMMAFMQQMWNFSKSNMLNSDSDWIKNGSGVVNQYTVTNNSSNSGGLNGKSGLLNYPVNFNLSSATAGASQLNQNGKRLADNDSNSQHHNHHSSGPVVKRRRAKLESEILTLINNEIFEQKVVKRHLMSDNEQACLLGQLEAAHIRSSQYYDPNLQQTKLCRINRLRAKLKYRQNTSNVFNIDNQMEQYLKFPQSEEQLQSGVTKLFPLGIKDYTVELISLIPEGVDESRFVQFYKRFRLMSKRQRSLVKFKASRNDTGRRGTHSSRQHSAANIVKVSPGSPEWAQTIVKESMLLSDSVSGLMPQLLLDIQSLQVNPDSQQSNNVEYVWLNQDNAQAVKCFLRQFLVFKSLESEDFACNAQCISAIYCGRVVGVILAHGQIGIEGQPLLVRNVVCHPGFDPKRLSRNLIYILTEKVNRCSGNQLYSGRDVVVVVNSQQNPVLHDVLCEFGYKVESYSSSSSPGGDSSYDQSCQIRWSTPSCIIMRQCNLLS